MPRESDDRLPTRAQNTVGPHQLAPPPKPDEPLACPRCQSTNTKFCYYNNYNLSQPRHFCKSCRRHWTHGGTLRNVPFGGGSRKNSKRSRSGSNFVSSSSSSSLSSATSTAALSALTTSSESLPLSLPATNSDPAPLPNIKAEPFSDGMNLNENLPATENANFLSLLNSHAQGAAGSMGISGYGGSGLGFGFCEPGLGFGFGGRGVWANPGMVYSASPENEGAFGSSGNAWQLDDDVEGGELDDGHCFAWPGLSISNPGRSLK